MSEGNVGVVLAMFETWNAGDMDAFSALHDANVVWMYLEGWPESATLVGREACRSQFERMRAAFDTDTVEPVGDLVTAGDRVVGRFVWRGTGRGPEVRMELSGVWTVRRGQILIIEHFWDHAEALEAIGLAP